MLSSEKVRAALAKFGKVEEYRGEYSVHPQRKAPPKRGRSSGKIT